MNDKTILVDLNDNEIGFKSRKDITKHDVYRISALWIMNSKKEILIAQRYYTKRDDPGKWTCAVCGTLEEGETYQSNIYKEAEEEIGLKEIIFNEKKKLNPNPKKQRYYFCQWYRAIVDKPVEYFTIQKDEVEAIRWISKDELKGEIKKFPENQIYSVEEIEELCEM